MPLQLQVVDQSGLHAGGGGPKRWWLRGVVASAIAALPLLQLGHHL